MEDIESWPVVTPEIPMLRTEKEKRQRTYQCTNHIICPWRLGQAIPYSEVADPE
jgi:hypothetical protein